MTRRRLLIPVTGLLVALGAVVALAAPNQSANVAAGGPAYTWQSRALHGALSDADAYTAAPCNVPGNDCDDTLINVTTSGGATAQGTVTIDGPDGNGHDLDLYVYKSNADAEAGAFVRSSTSGTADEQVTFDADPGYYLIRVYAATTASAAGDTYKGVAKIVPNPLPPDVDYGRDPANPSDTGATGAPGSTSLASDFAPSSRARAPRTSQALTLTGTASDRDGKVAYVDVGLVRLGKRGCTALRPNGKFRKIRKCSAPPPLMRAKGTKRWHLTLSKRLAKGSYVVYSRATDNLGRREGGFGPRNRVRFRIT
jgi:Bacterial pre-peptidase C-terminal domain